MNKLTEFLEKVANTKYTMNGSKISQRERNALKRDFVGVFVEYLQENISNDLITVVETQKGIGIAVDNEHIGFIPIEIVPTFKDTDCDIVDLASEYVDHKAEMEQKAQAKAKAKADKIAKDKVERERRALAQAQAESEEDGQEELE